MSLTPSKMDTLDEHPIEDGMEVHPAIQLLIARMESNPEEFYRYRPNQTGTAPNPNMMATICSQTLEHTKALWNRKEKRLYNMALRNVRLEEAHQRLMAAILLK